VAGHDPAGRLNGLAIETRYDVALSSLTTIGVGGPARRLLVPSSIEQLAAVVRRLRLERERFMVLGAGSNVLFADEGFAGTIVWTGRVCGIDVREGCVRAAAGTRLVRLLDDTHVVRAGTLDFLAGIPGSVGGAVASNAGIREASVADALVAVELLLPNGERVDWPPPACGFSYRRMAAVAEGAVVLSADLSLVGRRFDRKSLLAFRKATQPVGARTAGCVFRNPHDRPAGAMIDELGLKGLRVGDARISGKHANFIINEGQATCAQIRTLIDIVRRKVYKGHRVLLDLEIEVVG